MDREEEIGRRLSPLENISNRVKSNMYEGEILSALKRLLSRSLEESSRGLSVDPLSKETIDRCYEYQALAETLCEFGTLINSLEEHG